MIIQGDCRERLAGLSCDVMIADLAYSDHVHDSAVSCSSRRGATKRSFGFDSLEQDLRHWAATFASKSTKRWSVIWQDLESVGALKTAIEGYGGQYLRTTPWVRWLMPQLSADRMPQGAEAICQAWGHGPRSQRQWHGPGWTTHFDSNCLRGADKHKAEKPLDLLLDVVSWFSDPGDLVVDPVVGSGTTALACRLLQRDCVAVELDEAWAERAALREVSPLSDRDQERFERWLTLQQERSVKLEAILEKEPDSVQAKRAFYRLRQDVATAMRQT